MEGDGADLAWDWRKFDEELVRIWQELAQIWHGIGAYLGKNWRVFGVELVQI